MYHTVFDHESFVLVSTIVVLGLKYTTYMKKLDYIRKVKVIFIYVRYFMSYISRKSRILAETFQI